MLSTSPVVANDKKALRIRLHLIIRLVL